MAAPFDPTKASTQPRSHKLDPSSIHEFIEDLTGDDLHAQRVRSAANGVIGVLHAATLAIHATGEGLAVAMGLDPKHAIKQVDRLLSNRGVDVEALSPLWVSFVLAEREDIVAALDRTDFDGDEQTTLVLDVITTGRAHEFSCNSSPKYPDKIAVVPSRALPLSGEPRLERRVRRECSESDPSQE